MTHPTSPTVSAPTKRRGRKESAELTAVAATSATPPAPPTPPRITRGDTLTALMRADGGASAAELSAAVGWQVHSLRGFIAGTLIELRWTDIVEG